MSESDDALVQVLSQEILNGMYGPNPKYGVVLFHKNYQLLPDTLRNAITFPEILDELIDIDTDNQDLISRINHEIITTNAIEHFAVSVLISVINDFKWPLQPTPLVREMD
jgi:hypothetical protein